MFIVVTYCSNSKENFLKERRVLIFMNSPLTRRVEYKVSGGRISRSSPARKSKTVFNREDHEKIALSLSNDPNIMLLARNKPVLFLDKKRWPQLIRMLKLQKNRTVETGSTITYYPELRNSDINAVLPMIINGAKANSELGTPAFEGLLGSKGMNDYEDPETYKRQMISLKNVYATDREIHQLPYALMLRADPSYWKKGKLDYVAIYSAICEEVGENGVMNFHSPKHLKRRLEEKVNDMMKRRVPAEINGIVSILPDDFFERRAKQKNYITNKAGFMAMKDRYRYNNGNIKADKLWAAFEEESGMKIVHYKSKNEFTRLVHARMIELGAAFGPNYKLLQKR